MTRSGRIASFSSEVRRELAATLPREEHCRRALLAGILRTAGSFHLHGRGEVHVEIDLALNVVARRTFELLRLAGATAEVRPYSADRFGGERRFAVVVDGDEASMRTLRAAGALTAEGRPMHDLPAEVVRRSCCRRAYLRGAFMAGGSVAPPRRAAHLELRAHDMDGARRLQTLARRDGVRLAVHQRSGHALAYAKRLETISDLLAELGAQEAALRLAEAGVMANVRESANRFANADAGNLGRQIRAAREQLDAIAALRGSGRLAGLSEPLLEAAELREAHPELSLADIAEAAALPKPTLARRLRALVELAGG
jgi:DNA-binding protein WhiA